MLLLALRLPPDEKESQFKSILLQNTTARRMMIKSDIFLFTDPEKLINITFTIIAF